MGKEDATGFGHGVWLIFFSLFIFFCPSLVFLFLFLAVLLLQRLFLVSRRNGAIFLRIYGLAWGFALSARFLI